MRFPLDDKCFLCNEDVDFGESYEVAVSFRGIVANAAQVPSGFLWAHDACVKRIAHPSYALPNHLLT